MTETTRLLRDLVAIPSINPMGRPLSGPEFFEHRVTDYLEDFFRTLGVPYERRAIAPRRDNIIARYEPAGAKRTILFEVHQDTVPADNMTIDPFGANIENGRLYGRGACDIKGGMASMLAAFARLVRQRPKSRTAVILACVVDEEFLTQGAKDMVRRGMRADGAIVAEPTQLDIVNTHKGCVRWHLHTTGRSCHSSSPEQGVNAVYRMGKVVAGIESFAEKLRQGRRDPVLGPPSISVGRIEGGVSVNAVPDRCTIEIDRRVTAGEDPTQAQAELTAFLRTYPGIDFPFENETPWVCKGPLESKGSEALVEELGQAIDAVRGSHRVLGVPFGTDASTLAQLNMPCVVFGPGDVAQAHTCDEWVALDQVEQASEVLYRFASSD